MDPSTPEMLRDFLSRTRMPQEEFARRADLSLKTINTIKNAEPDRRFADETEAAVRDAISEYAAEEHARYDVTELDPLYGAILELDPEDREAVRQLVQRLRER